MGNVNEQPVVLNRVRFKMKILFIDEEFPYPLNSGKRIRTFNLTVNLARVNEVSYLAYGEKNSESYNYLEDNNIRPIAVDPPDREQSGLKFYFRLFMNLFSPYPYIVTSHFTKRFQNKLSQLLHENKCDVVICEWTPYAIFVKDIKHVKTVIVAHNIETLIWRRYEKNETNFLKKKYISLQRKKVEKFESSCFNWVNGATAVSNAEAREIESYGVPYSPTVIDNGVDTGYFHPMDVDVDSNQIVLTGAMDWRPNQDAAIYFTDEILPLIKKTKPDCKVVFVGRNPVKQVLNLAKNESVQVTGTVDDVRPYIARSIVFIVPLRIGGGTRLKILEAMSMEKPVISTSVGAEGLNVTDGHNILIADDPKQFAQAVIDCIDNKGLKEKLSKNGKELVDTQYRWGILGKKFNDYLLKIVKVL